MVIERLYLSAPNSALLKESLTHNSNVVLSFSKAELHAQNNLTPLNLNSKQAAAVKHARDHNMDLQLRLTPAMVRAQHTANGRIIGGGEVRTQFQRPLGRIGAQLLAPRIASDIQRANSILSSIKTTGPTVQSGSGVRRRARGGAIYFQ
jgi:hypothetical protein